MHTNEQEKELNNKIGLIFLYLYNTNYYKNFYILN